MWKKLILSASLAAFGGFLLIWAVFPRSPITASTMAALADPNLENGARVFWAGGCASCHAANGAEGEARLILAGGRAFETEFGTFYAPNISPDPNAGIGD